MVHGQYVPPDLRTADAAAMTTYSLKRCDNCGLTVPTDEGADWVYVTVTRGFRWHGYGVWSSLDREGQPLQVELHSWDCARSWMSERAEDEYAKAHPAPKKMGRKK